MRDGVDGGNEDNELKSVNDDRMVEHEIQENCKKGGIILELHNMFRCTSPDHQTPQFLWIFLQIFL